MAETSGNEPTEQVRAAAPTTGLANQNSVPDRQARLAGRKIRRNTSNFVQLAGLIVAGAVDDVGKEPAGLAFDEERLEGLLAHGLPAWAALRPVSGDRGQIELPEEFRMSTTIGIRAMFFESDGFHPLFGDLFRPAIRGKYVGPLDEITSFDRFDAWSDQGAGSSSASADRVERHGAGLTDTPFSYRYSVDRQTSLKAGVGWIQDLGDTTGLASSLDEPYPDGSSGSSSGVNLSLGGRYKAVSLTGGYIRALDSRSSGELALAGKDGDPIAWNSEIAYSTEWLRRETTLAVGYLKASDVLQDILPEERYRTRASMSLSDSTTFSLEYYQDREFDVGRGNQDGYGITTRIGVDF